jgi:hypothetical protein
MAETHGLLRDRWVTMTSGDLQSTNGLTVASTRAARRDQHDSGHDGNARRYRHQPRRHVPRREVVLGRSGGAALRRQPGRRRHQRSGDLSHRQVRPDLRVNGVKCDRNFRRLTFHTFDAAGEARESWFYKNCIFLSITRPYPSSITARWRMPIFCLMCWSSPAIHPARRGERGLTHRPYPSIGVVYGENLNPAPLFCWMLASAWFTDAWVHPRCVHRPAYDDSLGL